MTQPHHSDFTDVRTRTARLFDGILAAPRPRTGLPVSRPYAYAGDGTTVPDVPLTAAPVTPLPAPLCLHDAPAEPVLCAPPEWHREFDAELAS